MPRGSRDQARPLQKQQKINGGRLCANDRSFPRLYWLLRWQRPAPTQPTAEGLDACFVGIPLDDFAKRVARVEAVTAADVKRVASSILHPKTMKVVIVGDRAKISGELESLNLGAPDVRDPYGDPLK